MKKFNRKQLEQNRRRLERDKEKELYIAKMKSLADRLGGSGTFSLLPSVVVETSYKLRQLPVEVTAVNHPEFSHKTVKNAAIAVKHFMRDEHFALKLNNKSILLDDFLTAGFTFYQLLNWCKSTDKKEEIKINLDWISDFVARLDSFVNINTCQNALNVLLEIASFICYSKNDLENYLCWFMMESKIHEKNKQSIITLDLNRRKPETKYFKIDGIRRIAHCISFASCLTGFLEAKIKPSLMGVANVDKDAEVKVYVQKHALRRLEERVDCLEKHNLHASLFTSLVNPVIVRAGKNKALLTYCVGSSKVGYLLAEYIDEVVLIHTFLFITSNGTPEGQKLTELTGLGKLDKKYLAIDKLSSFIESDLAKNDKLRTLFEKAGCSCLLEIEDSVRKASIKHADNKNIEFVEHYLNIQEVQETEKIP